MRQQLQKIEDAIRREDSAGAITGLREGLESRSDEFVEKLRRKGVFRFAKYEYRSKTIQHVVEKVLSSHQDRLPAEFRTYLTSVLALGKLAPAVRSEYRSIRTKANTRSLKSYQVSIEDLFIRRWHRDPGADRTSWRGFALEELAEALSFYTDLVFSHYKPRATDTYTVYTEKVKSGYYLQRLAEIAKLIKFREAEIMIESFPYEATAVAENVRVQATSADFEKSIRWGYIVEEMQRGADKERLRTDNVFSIEDLAKAFVDKFGDKYFEIRQWPLERIRIHLPSGAAMARLLADECSFREDLFAVDEAALAVFVDRDVLLRQEVTEGVTLRDVLRFQRLMKFLIRSLSQFVQARSLLGSACYYRSLVAALKEEDAHKQISEATGVSNAAALLNLLSWSPGCNTLYDAQYRPLLRTQGWYLLPIAVAGESNLLRNVLQTTRFRFDRPSDVDPVSDLLRDAFAEQGVQTRKQVKFNFQGQRGDIDVLAVLDGRLFAFECKNSLHPCNVYELRQSYDYVRKAAWQLTRLQRLFKHPTFREQLSASTGLRIKECACLVTCVVTGNRMFSGWLMDGHPIRPVYELLNTVRGGPVVFWLPRSRDPHAERQRIELPLRPAGRLTTQALEDYLGVTPLRRATLNAFLPYEDEFRFGQRELRFRSFYWDLPAMRQELVSEGLVRT